MTSGARKDRLWIIGGIVAALVLAAASWFFLISPKLDDAASVRNDAAAAADQNGVLQIKVNKLRADSANLPDLLKQLDTLHTQLPTTLQLDAFTRQLTAQATAAKVDMKSIVVGAPTVVKAAPGPAAAPPTTSTAGDAGTNPEASDAAEEASGSEPSGGAVPSSAPAVVPTNLYAIPVTVAADGPIANQQKLLLAIQTQGPRGALVSSVQFSPAPDAAGSTGGEPAATQSPEPAGPAGPTVPAGVAGQGGGPATMTVQLTVFVAPQSPDDEAALRKQLGG